MKIYPCKTENEFPLSWSEINSNEGVYEPQGMPDYRFVVLISYQQSYGIIGGLGGYGSTPAKAIACFYVDSSGKVMGAVIGHEDRKFRRSSEKLCVELKKNP